MATKVPEGYFVMIKTMLSKYELNNKGILTGC